MAAFPRYRPGNRLVEIPLAPLRRVLLPAPIFLELFVSGHATTFAWTAPGTVRI